MKARKILRGVMVLTLTTAFAAMTLGILAQATPPGLVNYQGVLRDSSGNPVANGNYDMAFLFYDAATSGTLLLSDSHLTSGTGAVAVSGGLFTVALGSGTLTAGSESTLPAVFGNHATVYLAVKVGADVEMTPRIQVVSAPFAENCDTLDGKHAADFLSSSSSGNFLDTSATPQTKAGKLTLNSAVDYGVDATGTAGGHFKALGNTGEAYVGIGSTGISAFGGGAGGEFGVLGPSTGHAFVGTGDKGIEASGTLVGGTFINSTYNPSHGYAFVGYGENGIEGYGNGAGGYFQNLTQSGHAAVGFGNYGIDAYGDSAGGYFHGPGNGYAHVGTGNTGIIASGHGGAGGFFFDGVAGGYAYVGYGSYGIWAQQSHFFGSGSSADLALTQVGVEGIGDFRGGYFADSTSYANGWVGYDTYSFYGNSQKSFVQNHPVEKDKVIVYTCLEGDEVAVYTRGTAKLINGEAHIKLGETFKWVTNPDIGLTAHLTPHGEAVPLAVKSLNTNELVVKGPKDGPAGLAFDYIVYGLRIGFEESSIVQEKQEESFIPSFKGHRERYAKYPELRAFNSLERFKAMESSVRGVEPASINLSRAKALKDAIHEYDPATDPPIDKLFGFDHGHHPNGAPQPSGPSPVSVTQPAHPASRPGAPSDDTPANGAGEPAGGGATIVSKPALPCLPVSEVVEPGDVVVMDLSRKGNVRRCAAMADPLVVGIAGGPAEGCKAGQREEERFALARVPVASFGIVPCKVDAAYGAVREGDLLVASPTPGHAMRADNPGQGTVIGKALEPLATGTGLIKVLVMLR